MNVDDVEYSERWNASGEEDQKLVVPVDAKGGIQDLFTRAAFNGERIIMSSGGAHFAIVPIEDVLILDAQGL